MRTKTFSKERKLYIGLMKALMAVSAVLTCALVAFLIIYVMYKGLPNLSWGASDDGAELPGGQNRYLSRYFEYNLYRPGNPGCRAAAWRGRGDLSDGIRTEQEAGGGH